MTEDRPRGIDHVGLTVSDIDEAGQFIVEGLGGELLYEMLSPNDPPLEGEELEWAIGLPAGAKVVTVRMYWAGNGPAIELFRYEVAEQNAAPRASDLGWQHIAFYVDDLDAATARAVAAGGVALSVPWDMIGPESGPGNRFCFVRSPLGALIEFVTYPSTQAYRRTSLIARWMPRRSDDRAAADA